MTIHGTIRFWACLILSGIWGAAGTVEQSIKGTMSNGFIIMWVIWLMFALAQYVFRKNNVSSDV